MCVCCIHFKFCFLRFTNYDFLNKENKKEELVTTLVTPFLGTFFSGDQFWVSKTMPFIGQDWRAPGEEWVKYDGGWEKKSVVTITTGTENITEHLDLMIQPVEKPVTRKSLVTEAVATLSRGSKNLSGVRRKNLSECHDNGSNKENQGPIEYHRLLLQEHIRRIQGHRNNDLSENVQNEQRFREQPNQELPRPQQPFEVNEVNQQLQQLQHNDSPHRTNRYAQFTFIFTFYYHNIDFKCARINIFMKVYQTF